MKLYSPTINTDLQNMKYSRSFLVFYLFETWEKIILTHIYVNSREYKRSKRNTALVNSYTVILRKMTEQLDKLVIPFFIKIMSSSKFSEDEYFQAINNIHNVLVAVFSLHEDLNLLSGRTEVQGSHNFIRKIEVESSNGNLLEKSWLKHAMSIVLSDNYDFSQKDINTKFCDILRKSNLESPYIIDGNELILKLPKIEVDNPLMWPILVNELSNVMIRDYKLLESIEAEMSKSDLYADRNRIISISKIKDICVYLISLRLLGPAYFYSKTSYEIIKNQQINSVTETSQIMEVFDLTNNLDFNVSEKLLVSKVGKSDRNSNEDLTTFFLNLHFYQQIILNNNIDKSKLQNKTIEDEPNLINTITFIEGILKRAHVPKADFCGQEKITFICKKLIDNQPISSVQTKKISKKDFMEKLQNVNNPRELYSILPPTEEVLSVSSILFGGWMVKIHHDFPILQESLIRENTLVNIEKNYLKTVIKRNELLNQSISNAFMMEMYCKWRAHD